MATIHGSYDQPIVMGLTPWNRTLIRVGGLAGAWPPDSDAERLMRYEQFEALIEARHSDAFARLGLATGQQEKISLAVALPELLCNVWADSVWNDQPSIELPSDAAEDAWKEIDEANEWSEIRGWESVFAAAMRGTSIIRLFKSEELGAITGSPVQIEEVPAGMFFPKLRKGSDRLLDYVVLAWEENRGAPDGKDEIWQVRETHAMNDGKYAIATDERRAKERDFRRVAFEQTDIDFLPFVDMHAGRWSGRYWGVSELTRCMTLFDDVDNTLSNLSNVLEYHGDPMLQVPAGALFGGVLAKGSNRTVGIRNAADKDVARYITYDGELSSHLAELDKVIELIMLTSEVPEGYFGRGVNGELGSGTAMRLQLQNYLKKATRWQRRESMRSKTVVDYALRLSGKVSDAEARKAKIGHGSPLPADDVQEATIEQGLFGAGMSSLELSLRKLRRVPTDEIDDEIARIEDAKAESVQAAQDAFSAAPDPTADPNAPAPPQGRQGPPPSRRGGASAQRQR